MDIRSCPDCNTEPGQRHAKGCDVERCSACGSQRFLCLCGGKHDPQFSRWTGLWPGSAEASELGIDLNTFYAKGYHEIMFVKP